MFWEFVLAPLRHIEDWFRRVIIVAIIFQTCYILGLNLYPYFITLL